MQSESELPEQPTEGQKVFVAWRYSVGTVLVLSSLPFLWRGTNATGAVDIKLPFVTAQFGTTSAGLGLLIAGVLLLIPRGQGKREVATDWKALAVGTAFYVFVGLLPAIALGGIWAYMHFARPEAVDEYIPLFTMWALYIEVPLLVWVSTRVAGLLNPSNKAA